ncbi:MAG: putative ABC transporter permease [Carnobacterium maltaromaticum]
MEIKFEKIVLLFFIYAFIGWLWETVYCSIKAKKFVYRGFLIGPYCPIYGFGVLAVLSLISPYQQNIILLYVFSALVVTLLEYVTSYGLEKLFHTTWWDYHDVPLNLNGRIALPISLFWGVGCVFIVKVVQPIVTEWVQFLINQFGIFLPVAIVVLMTVDLIYSVFTLAAFQKELAKLSVEIEERKNNLVEKITETSQTLMEELKQSTELKKAFAKLNFNQKRMLRAYSKLNMPTIKNFKELKEIQERFRKKG